MNYTDEGEVDIGTMTIRDLEDAAFRVKAALEVLREAGALGLSRPAQAATTGRHIEVVGGAPATGRTLHWSGPGGATAVMPQPPATPVEWKPEELAMREKLLKGIRADPSEEEQAP